MARRSEHQQQQIGRLAMRQEGEYWNAYYALPANVRSKGKILLGSIRMVAVMENEERKVAFMQMMRDIVSEIIEAQTGVRPMWNEPTPAPECERSGHA